LIPMGSGKSSQDIRVLVTRDLPEIAVGLLREAGFQITAWSQDRPMTQPELIEKAKVHNAILCSITDKIDVTFLNACGHLDIISQFGVGYDNIDIPETKRLGIPVGNTPDVLTEATADVAFGLMIAVSRKMFFMHKSIEKGEWKSFKPKSKLGMELRGKTLGVFGLGRIGLAMARRCKGAFDMDVIYHNRREIPSSDNIVGARWVSLPDLLQQSDVLSVHCALTEETKGMFNKHIFEQMKPTSIFINTSRGLVHNEIDLIQALQAGRIWGAGLDVTNPEPMLPDNPLLQMENVAILPHIGSATIEARNGMARLAAENIIEFYRSGNIPHRVTS
jgi:glyoxylate reductase